MKRTSTVVMAAAIAAALTLPLGPANAGSKNHSTHSGAAIGLSSGTKLFAFKLAKPGRPAYLGKVSGLAGDSTLVGIDYRVQDGKLYGVGNAGGVYTLTSTGQGHQGQPADRRARGAKFGVDFNPAADRLRVVSDTGQNLRHDVNPGGATIVDGTLTYPPAIAAGERGQRGGVHEQRPRRRHGHHAVRPGHRAGPGRDPGAGQRGPAVGDRQARRGCRQRRGLRHRRARGHNAGTATVSVGGEHRLYPVAAQRSRPRPRATSRAGRRSATWPSRSDVERAGARHRGVQPASARAPLPCIGGGVREAYAAHGAELYRFALRGLGDAATAQDAVQETFLRAWRARDSYDPQVAGLRVWLFGIARNVVIDLHRAHGARPVAAVAAPTTRRSPGCRRPAPTSGRA